MNARTCPEKLFSDKPDRKKMTGSLLKVSEQNATANPVLEHMESLKGQLQDQLDSLNAVVDSMQRISGIMERMAKKRCKLNGVSEFSDKPGDDKQGIDLLKNRTAVIVRGNRQSGYRPPPD